MYRNLSARLLEYRFLKDINGLAYEDTANWEYQNVGPDVSILKGVITGHCERGVAESRPRCGSI